MHGVKQKMCWRAFRGIQELQSFGRLAIIRRDFTGSSRAAALFEERKRTDHVTEGWAVSSANLIYDRASSWVQGSDLRLRKPKLECLLRMERLQIGGLRQMGITTRPSDRAAEHGVRNPLPNADGSQEGIEERRQDEFLRSSRKVTASKVQQFEEAVGVQGGTSFQATDAETKEELGMNSADLVQETASEFTKMSEFHSTGSQPGAEVHYDGNLSDGIDEEVQRGLIADSEHPAGRIIAEDDRSFSSSEDQEGLITGTLGDGDLGIKEVEKDRTDKLYSTNEARDKGTAVESGAPKLVAEDREKSKDVY